LRLKKGGYVCFYPSIKALLFISENAGKSVNDYSFITQIENKLICVENAVRTEDIYPQEQRTDDMRR